jgi:hypothetical protein
VSPVRPDGKAAKTERVTFTRPAAERIAAAVRSVERGDRDISPTIAGPRLQGDTFRLKLATFTGSWAVGTFKTVTLSGSTSTASVYNWCTPVDGSTTSTATKHVIFGNVKGTASAIEVQRVGYVRIGKVTAAWSKGTVRDVEVWEEGSPASETSSGYSIANCVNKFADVQENKWVAVSQAPNGEYYLISAEC